MTEKRILGTVTLPGDTASVRLFRRFVADIIGTYWPTGAEKFDDVVLLTSESVTNSVVHSDSRRGGVVTLSLIASDAALRVEVLDAGGETLPVQAQAGELCTSGRGVFLVEALARGFGHRVDAQGRLLTWFEV
ncbi:ATP-binding protein [Actinomadura sp. 9N407]|uniref:ATP-binding protein n=1 Tax=Actinomadura sp. 9N407 TaxID=3375154 RepID=UPI0037B932FC